MDYLNQQHQNPILPILLPRRDTGDTRRDSSEPTHPTQPAQPSASGASTPPSNETITPSIDVQGLREQIFSNAAVVFPQVTFQYQNAFQYQNGYYAPRDVFDVVVLRRRLPPAAAAACAEPGVTDVWCAYLLYGPLTSRSAAASGLCRKSVEGALQALLEFLAGKVGHKGQFEMSGLKRDRGSQGLDPNLLGPYSMLPGMG